jgi:DNA-binding LytR/AlgR family response regulator
MKKVNCIIIEDEHLLAEVLADYVRQVPFLELRAVLGDAVTASEFLQAEPVELIFIDINLPKLKGIDFIKAYRGNARFVVTTAYHEYAVEGYELDVADYLLKPISFARFLKAVNKAVGDGAKNGNGTEAAQGKDYFYIGMNKKRVKVNFADLLYVEGMKEYVKIYLAKDRFLVTKLQIGVLEGMLTNEFVRIHRSFIVARHKITAYSQAEVCIGDIVLPVGTNYKDSLAEMLE